MVTQGLDLLLKPHTMGRPVHLFLQVKVRENWLDEAERYNEMGLDFRDGDA